jgi:hypothetical protein
MMKTVDRRKFLKNSVAASAGIFAGMNSINLLASTEKNTVKGSGFSATIPLPIQVVIDDVGWWSGHDGSEQQEPYRTGISRDHVPADYTAIAKLGKSLGIRPQAAMVLCEWDKKNILRKLPTATWMGKDWDNSKWVGPWLEEAAGIIRENGKHIELTFHGVGHEYWTNGKFTRAEWADVNGRMRPRDQVEKHLDFFEKIIQQHWLGPFPTSFVPTAFNHGFGVTPGHDVSMAEILSKRGIKYINTPFHQMYNAGEVSHKYFGFDSDVLTVDRGKDVLTWDATGMPPTGRLKGPTCGMHWANLIHPDPYRNQEIVDAWVQFLAPYNDKEDTMLASDSGSFQSQLLYHECAELLRDDNNIFFDFKKLGSFPGDKVKKTFTLKIKSKPALQFSSDSLKTRSHKSKKSGEFLVTTLELERIQESDKASINTF